MPTAETRLQIMQVSKLLQCVREGDKDQIRKLCSNGVPQLINYNEPINGDTALSTAAIANKDDIILTLLELGAHPDVIDFQGRTAAMRAAEYGHLQCLERLVKPTGLLGDQTIAEEGKNKKKKKVDPEDEVEILSADMTMKDLKGRGILWYCINTSQRHEACAELAMRFGADVHNTDNNGEHVFVKACETASENEQICLRMMQKGADANSLNEKSNRTALMAACRSGSHAVVRALLERGAEVDKEMLKIKTTAAHESAKSGCVMCLFSLHAYQCHFDVYDEKGSSPLHYAAENGSGPCCKFLIQRGCNPKPKNNEGLQAKIIAKEKGNKEAGKELRKGEKSFGKSGKNNDPWILSLYDFTIEKNHELMEYFLRVDVDGKGTVSKEDFLEQLQNLGAPLPNETDMTKLLKNHEKDGRVDFTTFLSGKKYVNKLYLLSAFEPKKKKKKKGKGGRAKKTKIPMPICVQPEGPRTEYGQPPIVYLQEHDILTDIGRFDRDRPPKHPLNDDSAWYLHKSDTNHVSITAAAVNKDYDTLQDSILRGIPIDLTDKYYKTALMVCCQNGDLQSAKWLIEKGANVNASDNFKWTPLHFACHSGQRDLVEYLLDNGAHIDVSSLCGATPIMRAIESCKPEVVQLLIDRGAKMLCVNKKEENVCDVAAAYGDFRVYDIVKTKYDSVPKPKEKKGGKSAKKRPASKAGVEGNKVPTSAKPEGPLLEALQMHRKGSILRAASALAGGLDEHEDITYIPKAVWTKVPTTEELIHAREIRRDRFGWQVDFEDFRFPFNNNIHEKLKGIQVD